MELDEFVRRTIEQVISGVGQACEHAKKIRAEIGGGAMHPIEFDVAVTATEESQKNKNAGITVAGIGLGMQGKTELTNSAVSRIKFSVLVSLPSTESH